ncbi:MAG: beta-galactosidase [Defluviitaleaceae bacterium]|nr:beta-galactosidase [Defluviitaleaceae bacterium]
MHIEIHLPNYTLDPTPLPFRGENKARSETVGITSKYFTKNGEPWFPVMGEIQYSRYNNACWEDEIQKMKAGGLGLIATYVFWIHHEETEGAFDFGGDRNLRAFIGLCHKNDMKLLLRIGPWAHGECRNGGFPDWLCKKGFELRSDDAGYLALVKKLFDELYLQAEGFLYKDGGPVIGVQLENEYGHCGGFGGEKGRQHMLTLKKMAVQAGFDVPFYTATGWGGGIVVEGETLPVLGAYADAPWDASNAELPASEKFLFSHVYDDKNIGSDFRIDKDLVDSTFDPANFPYITAELGGGVQVTWRRRPVITAKDTEALVYARLGSGANLLGYYLYHGGTNFIGKLSTLQESNHDPGGRGHKLPILSYDFQGVLGEYGERHGSYGYLRLLHMLLNDFGKDMADAAPYIPDENAKDPDDTESLRFCVRHGTNGGFLFVNHYQRHRKLTEKSDVSLRIHTRGSGDVAFEYPKIKEGQSFIHPFDWEVEGIKIKKAQAQPICIICNENETTLFFWSYGTSCEFDIDGKITVNAFEPLTLQTPNGKPLKIILLDRESAEKVTKTTVCGKDILMLTDDEILSDGSGVSLCSTRPNASALVYPQNADFIAAPGWEREEAGIFSRFSRQTGNKESDVEFTLTNERGNGDRFYRIHLPELFKNEEDDIFLEIDFAGDIANLFIDGRLSADWFYTGLTWRVGLKKFKDKINGAEIVLQIKPLYKDAPMYLEIFPAYENGRACALNSVKICEQRRFEFV